jgi:hypothetical protein
MYLFVLIILVALFSFADWWGNSILRLVTVGGASWPLVRTAFDTFSGLGNKSRKSA